MNEHSRVFHLQSEHYEEKLGDLIKETSDDALENGWLLECNKRIDQSRHFFEQVEHYYCPSCQKLDCEFSKIAINFSEFYFSILRFISPLLVLQYHNPAIIK